VNIYDTIKPKARAKNITIYLNAANSSSITAMQVNDGSTDNCALDSFFVFPNTFNCTNIGSNTVTLKVKDKSGNYSTTTAIVTVKDPAPPMANAKNLFLQLDSNGTASITASQANDNSTDNCSIRSMALSKSDFDCSNIGVNNCILTVTDIDGNTDTASFTVTIRDIIAPVVKAHDVVIYLDSTGHGSVTAAQVDNGSTDACGIASRTLNKTQFSCGDYIRRNKALDFDGVNDYVNVPASSTLNLSSFTVETWVKTTQSKPMARLIAKSASGRNNYTLMMNSGYPQVRFDNILTSFSAQGGYTINDGQWHHIAGVYDQSAGSLKLYIDGTLVATSAASGTPVNNTEPMSLGRFDGTFGMYSAATLDDIRVWNIARSASQIADNYAGRLIGNESGLVLYYDCEEFAGSNILTNKAGNASLNATLNNMNLGSCWVNGSESFSVSNIVTLTVKDNNNNSSTATAKIIVRDTLAPVARAHNLSLALGTSGTVSILPSQIDNGSTDNCIIDSITVTPFLFNCGNLGTNNVVLMVKDVTGNVSTANATVTIFDSIGPVALAHDVTIYTDSNGVATLTPSMVDNGSYDNCSITNMTVSRSSFDCSNIRSTWNGAIDMDGTNDYIETDDDGSLSLVSFTVETWVKTTRSQVNGRLITKSVDGQQNYSLLINSGYPQIRFDNDFTFKFAQGTTSIIDGNWHHLAGVYDKAAGTLKLYVDGNLAATNSTAMGFPVTGTEPLSIGRFSDQFGNYYKASLDEVRVWNIARTASQIKANMSKKLGGSETGLVLYYDFSETPGSGYVYNKATNQNLTGSLNNMNVNACWINGDNTFNSTSTITFTVYDYNAYSSTATVKVNVADTIRPKIITRNIVISLNAANNSATITPADINNGSTDGCGIDTIYLSKLSFNCSNIGDNVVTLYAKDVNGNIGSGTAVVTVHDTVNPVAHAQNITAYLNGNGTVTVSPTSLNNGSTDNCTVANYSLSKTIFDCSNLGNNTVTFTAIDADGRTNSTTAVIQVRDTIKPVAVPKNIDVYLNAAGIASASAAQLDNGSTDNCSIAGFAISKNSFSCANLGPNNIAFTVTDGSGNTATANAVITVKDSIRPVASARDLTVGLAGYNITITPAQINSGSTDNCSIQSMSVSPNTFDTTQLGYHTITLTVTDNSGNISSDTSTIYVVRSFPTVEITQKILPEFCQGGYIMLTTAITHGPVTYLWSNNATTPNINVTSSGTYSVTVTNIYGLTATASISVSVNTTALLSSYTMLATEHIDLKHGTVIKSGGAGVNGANGELKAYEESMITASGTFAKAVNIDVSGNSVITNKYYANPAISLPTFKYNPYYTSTNNKTVSSYASVTITDSVIGNLDMGQYSTVTFTRPVIYIKDLNAAKGCTIRFSQAYAEVRVYNDIDLKEDNLFNPDMKSVVVYCGDDINIKKNTNVNSSMYCLDLIKVEANSNFIDTMTGMFIAKKIESHWTAWRMNTVCATCNSNKTGVEPEADEKGLISGDKLHLKIFPNPNNGNFELDVVSNESGQLSVSVYDITGRVVYNTGAINFTGTSVMPVSLENIVNGYYFVRVELNGAAYTQKILVNSR
jgi:hypothetical protein